MDAALPEQRLHRDRVARMPTAGAEDLSHTAAPGQLIDLEPVVHHIAWEHPRYVISRRSTLSTPPKPLASSRRRTPLESVGRSDEPAGKQRLFRRARRPLE